MRQKGRYLALAVALALWLVGLPVLADDGGTALLGEQVTLDAGEVQQDDLVLFGGELQMLSGSLAEGDVAVVGGNAQIAGEVRGTVSVIGGTLSLEQGALVHGDVVVAGTLRYRHPEAVVQGQVIEGIDAATGWEYVPDVWSRWFTPNYGAGAHQDIEQPVDAPARGLGQAGGILLSLLVAAAAMAAVPDNVRNTRRVMVSSAPLSIGVGLLTMLAAAVLIPLLVVICIGIPVAAVLGLALVVCVALAWVAAGYLVGEKVLAWLKVSASPLAQAVAGVLLLGILSLIPCLGALLAILVACWGVGAVVLTRFGTRLDPIWTLSNGSAATTVEGKVMASATQAPVEQAPDVAEAPLWSAPEAENEQATAVEKEPPTVTPDTSSGTPGTRPLDERALDELERDADDELSSL